MEWTLGFDDLGLVDLEGDLLELLPFPFSVDVGPPPLDVSVPCDEGMNWYWPSCG